MKRIMISILLILLLIGCATTKIVRDEPTTEEPGQLAQEEQMLIDFTYGWEYLSENALRIFFNPDNELESVTLAIETNKKPLTYAEDPGPKKEFSWVAYGLTYGEEIRFVFLFVIDGNEYYIDEVYEIKFEPKKVLDVPGGSDVI